MERLQACCRDATLQTMSGPNQAIRKPAGYLQLRQSVKALRKLKVIVNLNDLFILSIWKFTLYQFLLRFTSQPCVLHSVTTPREPLDAIQDGLSFEGTVAVKQCHETTETTYQRVPWPNRVVVSHCPWSVRSIASTTCKPSCCSASSVPPL